MISQIWWIFRFTNSLMRNIYEDLEVCSRRSKIEHSAEDFIIQKWILFKKKLFSVFEV